MSAQLSMRQGLDSTGREGIEDPTAVPKNSPARVTMRENLKRIQEGTLRLPANLQAVRTDEHPVLETGEAESDLLGTPNILHYAERNSSHRDGVSTHIVSAKDSSER